MTGKDLRERIRRQFSYRGEHAEIWRAFEPVLDTAAFLNIGYSPWYLPHVLGSSQRRLAAKIASELAARLPDRTDKRLLDVGCGRGGPTLELAERVGASTTGVDLVGYNVATARQHAKDREIPAEFLVGDATRLPIEPASIAGCVAIDSIVYVPEKDAVFGELARVLEDDVGVLAVSDLLTRNDPDRAAADAVEDFAATWDMASLSSVDRYLTTIEGAGFAIEDVWDITANSTGRFRTWTGLYLALDEHTRGFIEKLFARWGVDRKSAAEQIRAAHRALPHLRHVVVYATVA